MDVDDVGAVQTNMWQSCGKRLWLQLGLELSMTVNTWNDCDGWQLSNDAK